MLNSNARLVLSLADFDGAACRIVRAVGVRAGGLEHDRDVCLFVFLERVEAERVFDAVAGVQRLRDSCSGPQL